MWHTRGYAASCEAWRASGAQNMEDKALDFHMWLGGWMDRS